MKSESEIQSDVRLAVGQLRDVCIWRNNVGETTDSRGHRPRRVRYGLCVGSSDLIGIGPGGRFLALEIKVPGKRPTVEQQMFLDLVVARGGIAACVHSAEEALAVIAAAREVKGEEK